ncbi:M20/M25/M40 family metallo-hydrolase [Sphingomonas sp. A2-49]|uniref:M20/M25/M40 family metallo-hydrolase n=1 Tax=Sphingomonas sp. A2-49 TaxID=1391375 RepID=UPI0021CDFBBF|nr:M20/M25/M40 family metallo-hydrolase [Sphingomonas sp. A2-49]MCU6452725.1 M20/M25/M40 family metallo-hydrolase [Sphingomonas sp. A2-49]
MRRSLTITAAVVALGAAPAPAQDRAAVATIIDQGTNHSQVVQTAQYLTDVIGPRLANSPGARQAEEWTQRRFREWGLRNVRKEGFVFGRGWSIDRASVRMVTPRVVQLTAIPIAWTPGTNGTITAPVVVAPITRERDFARYRGQLRGKIVMVTLPRAAGDPTDIAFRRLSGDDIGKLDQFQQPSYDPATADRRTRRLAFAKQLDAFLKAEGAVAMATMSYRDGKLVHGEGYLFGVGDTPSLPAVQIAQEDYLRLARLAKTGPAPTLEIASDVRFDDSDTQAYNVIAELPGTDPKAGYVMAGAHLDSWVAGDGAADNAAGSAEVMEAARILAASGIRPKRTIRFVLWAAEEEGLLGSVAYAKAHLARRGPGDPQGTDLGHATRWPIVPLAGHGEVAAYFNIDNGSGRLRGLYAENSPAVVPIFRDWLAPFASMGAGNVVARQTGGTDHMTFQQLGIPGFQFIQDPLDYGSRVHHSSVDTFDHLRAEDLRQGSIVLASVLLSAANADKALPRPPLPTQPVVTDPFAYSDPNDD